MKLIIPILVATLLVGLAVGGGAGYVVGDRQGDSGPVVAAPTVGPVPGSCDYYRKLDTNYMGLVAKGCAQWQPVKSDCNCGY